MRENPAVMSWLEEKLRGVTDATAATPIECPRGWGPVSFHLEINGFIPFFSFERKCPIGGVTQCDSCRHPLNPGNIAQLRTNLTELEQLYGERKLSEREYNEQRQLITGLQDHGDKRRREAFRITAWILGPLGILLTAAGCWFAEQDAKAMFMITPGAVMVALAISFAWLARTKKTDSGTAPW